MSCGGTKLDRDVTCFSRAESDREIGGTESQSAYSKRAVAGAKVTQDKLPDAVRHCLFSAIGCKDLRLSDGTSQRIGNNSTERCERGILRGSRKGGAPGRGRRGCQQKRFRNSPSTTSDRQAETNSHRQSAQLRVLSHGSIKGKWPYFARPEFFTCGSGRESPMTRVGFEPTTYGLKG